jgi:hypothetical protein
MKSGIYVVELLKENYTNAHETRQRGRGTLVPSGSVKFGKTRNLDRRAFNYEVTFGLGNFIFKTILIKKDIDKIENEIKVLVNQYRIIGVYGRKLEWLTGITLSELIKVIQTVSNKYE